MAEIPSLEGAKAAIRARLVERWGDTTPIAGENTDLDLRTGKAIQKQDSDAFNVPWIYLMIEDAGANQLSFGLPGSRQFVDDGIVRVVVFVPEGDGRARADELADRVAAIFRVQEFHNEVPGRAVRTWTPRRDPNGKDDDGLWWSVIVSVPFEFLYLG